MTKTSLIRGCSTRNNISIHRRKRAALPSSLGTFVQSIMFVAILPLRPAVTAMVTAIVVPNMVGTWTGAITKDAVMTITSCHRGLVPTLREVCSNQRQNSAVTPCSQARNVKFVIVVVGNLPLRRLRTLLRTRPVWALVGGILP